MYSCDTRSVDATISWSIFSQFSILLWLSTSNVFKCSDTVIIFNNCFLKTTICKQIYACYENFIKKSSMQHNGW